MAGIHLGGQITEHNEKNFNLVKEALICYKKIRKDIPSAIPFYPLGLPKYGADIACVAFECEECIRLCAWCFKEGQSVSIPIKGKGLKVLYPSDTEVEVNLTDKGISARFPRAYTSVVLEIIQK